MISALLANSKMILIVFVISIFAIGGLFTVYLKNELDKSVEENAKLEVKYSQLNNDYKTLDKNFDDTLVVYEDLLQKERDKVEFQSISLKEKEDLIKANSKVKQEVIKRGVIKNEKDSNFTITKF